MPHIAYDKNSRHVGFQQARIAIERPGRWPLPVAEKVRTGKNEAALVAINRSAKPFRAWLRADENEQARSGKLLSFSRGRTFDGDAREPRLSFHLDDPCPRPDLD